MGTSTNVILIIFILFTINSSQSINTATWMKDLGLGNYTLQQITLPGTHDSGSANVTSVVIDVPGWIDAAIKVADELGIPVGSIIDSWAQTQRKTIYEQFQSGIRYVDVRIVYYGGAWKIHHGPVLGLTTISQVLQNAYKFASDNPTEIVILELSHQDPSTTPQQEAEMITLIHDTVYGRLWPKSGGFVPISKMSEAQRNIIVTLTFGNDPYIWGGDTIINTYANSDDLQTMETYNNNQVQSWANHGIYPGNLFKISWTLTPNADTIFESIIPGHPHTLLELADIACSNLEKWFDQQIAPKGYKYPILGNIFIIDDFANSPILKIVTRGQ